MAEAWRQVVGWEGLYEVSDFGNVRSVERVIPNGGPGGKTDRLQRSRTLKLQTLATGYLAVSLCRDGTCRSFYVHRLVAAAFIGVAPDAHDVCHGDGTRTNNRPENLRYGTRSENVSDTFEHGRAKIGQSHHMTKLNDDAVRAIRAVAGTELQRVTAGRFGVSRSRVSMIQSGADRKHVEP